MILEKYSNLQSQLPYLPHLILLSTLILGMVIGLMISVLMPQSKSECKIEYISRDEILAFEKARIERTKEQKLFFGKARDAIGLIEKFAKLRGNQGSHVVFVKGSFVRGPGVSSISAEIHSEVVQSLREGAAKKIKQSDYDEDSDEDRDGDEENDEDDEDEHDLLGGRSEGSPAMKLLRQLDEDEKW